MEEISKKYMRRALELASFGAGLVSPNPMVGAVIVSKSGKIIGEGWHRRFGEPHAEVNAVNSVAANKTHLLPESTIYVTLEPCSHFGKTPPCSRLLIEKKFKRVVVGTTDPFREVSGRGIEMLRKAGIDVVVPFLEEECRKLNKRFITAHSFQRPFILLKWAQSPDGFIGRKGEIVKISNPVSMVAMHRERAMYDAIMVGSGTLINDNPTLTNRLWGGNSPRPVIFASRQIPKTIDIFKRNPIILNPSESLQDNVNKLYREHGITSMIVEGGAKLLQSFINEGLYDEIRIETSNIQIKTGIIAPAIPNELVLEKFEKIGNNKIELLKKPKNAY